MTQPYTVKQTGSSVLSVTFDDVKVGWDQWLLLRSDAHHDSPFCNRTLEKKHLDKALERDALIADGGDLFDAMQGRFDPRRNMDEVREEDAHPDYYNRIVDHAAEFYDPYMKHWVLFAKGNHESSVLKNANIDLHSMLYNKLRKGYVGGYGGWMSFHFNIHKTKHYSISLKYFHGAGGDAPVTRGTIQTNRQAVYLPDADIVWNGHIHNSFVIPIARERKSQKDQIYKDIAWHIRTPGYKDAYADGTQGWEVERGSPPKPMGCCWLHFFYDNTRSNKIWVDAIQDVE